MPTCLYLLARGSHVNHGQGGSNKLCPCSVESLIIVPSNEANHWIPTLPAHSPHSVDAKPASELGYADAKHGMRLYGTSPAEQTSLVWHFILSCRSSTRLDIYILQKADAIVESCAPMWLLRASFGCRSTSGHSRPLVCRLPPPLAGIRPAETVPCR